MMRSQGLFTPRTFFRLDPILTKKERTTCESHGRVAQIHFWPRWPSDTLLTVKYFGDRQTVSAYVCPFWNSSPALLMMVRELWQIWCMRVILLLKIWSFYAKTGNTIDANYFILEKIHWITCNATFVIHPKIPTLTKRSGSVPIWNRKQMVQRQ